MNLELQSNWRQRLVVCLWTLLAVATGQLPPATFDISAQQKLNSHAQEFESEPLTLNKTVKGTVPANGFLAYSITLSAREYLQVQIVSSQIDVSVTDPAGQTVVERAADNRQRTPLSIVSKTPGQYVFMLRPAEQSRVAAHFTLDPVELRTATTQDLNRIQAEQLFTEAVRLRRKWQTESSEKALTLFQRAQKLWTSAADHDGQNLALLNLCRTYESLDQTAKALDCYGQVLTLSENISDKRRQLEALARLTSLYSITGEAPKALEYGERTLELSTHVQDKHIEAETLNNIGDSQYLLNNIELALEYYNRSLAVWDSTDDLAGKAQVETSFGYAYLSRSEAENASKSFHDAVAFSQHANSRQLFAQALRGLGSLYTKLGQPQRGLEAFRQALELIQQGEGKLLKARVLAGMGYAYERLGDSEKALAYDTEALQVFRQIGNRWGESELLMDLGRVNYFRGDNNEALLSYNRALSLFREFQMERYEAQTLGNIGLIYSSRGNKSEALNYYNRSLQLTGKDDKDKEKRYKDERYHAYTLNYLGELEASQGQDTAALDKFNLALTLIRIAKDPIGEAITLYNLASSYRDLGQLVDAAKHSEAALKIIESIRASVAGEKLRASFGASVHQQYELRVDILMRQHQQQPSQRFDVAALETSERGRARSWLESFAEAEIDIRAGVDQSLLQRADSLRKKLDDTVQEGVRLMSRPQTSKDDALVLVQRKLKLEYEEVIEQIRTNNQSYAKVPKVALLSSEQIQKLLDDNTLLLEFSLGEDRSYVWAVSPTSIDSFTLPGRKVIETTCKDLYQALTNPSRVAAQEAEVTRLSQQLSNLILDPVESLLGDKRLLIVSDGALQYIPFEVLRSSEKSTQISERLLTDTHEIVYLPSASVMARQQARMVNRIVASKTLAIFADPVFDSADSRLFDNNLVSNRTTRRGHVSPRLDQTPSYGKRDGRARTNRSESSSTGALRAAGFDQGIPRLPFSYQEAQRITALIPDAERLVAVGFDANRTGVINTDLTSYRWLHFATHGLFNSDDPELSGILLSMVDRKGNSQDGLLQLHEIYNLHLPVDLVVLSACQTALGKELRGEGLFGMTRGFMHAGARQVVSSLWKVDDSATAALMDLFYQEMLVKESSPAAALKNAKASLRKQRRWQKPFYWAGFIIHGDWK